MTNFTSAVIFFYYIYELLFHVVFDTLLFPIAHRSISITYVFQLTHELFDLIMLFQMTIVIHPAFWSNNDFLMRLFCFTKCRANSIDENENEENIQAQEVMLELQHFQAVSPVNPVFSA